MKYLRKFQTEAAYEAAEDNLDLPNVSLIAATGLPKFKPLAHNNQSQG